MAMSSMASTAMVSMVTKTATTTATMMMPTAMPVPVPASIFPDPLEPIKQECGRQKVPKKYDLGLHVLGLFLVLVASILGAGFPVLAKKIKWLRIPPRVFFFCKHFGTGVLIATAFVHLLPTAFISLTDPCLPSFFTEKYPALAGVIGLMALFSLFAVELWMHSKLPQGHCNAGITGEAFSGKLHQVAPRTPGFHQPPWMIQSRKGSIRTDTDWSVNEYTPQFREQEEKTPVPKALTSVEQARRALSGDNAGHQSMIEEITPSASTINIDVERRLATEAALTRAEQRESRTFGLVDLDPDTVDPAVYRKMAMEISLLEGGILFHSIFVGMTVSITIDGFIVLLIAILFHQVFEGLGLGARIAAVPYARKSFTPWGLVLAFGTTAPIGQAIGLAAHASYDPQSPFALILVGSFNAISSGLLIYASLVDLLSHDFLSPEADRLLTNNKKMLAFTYVLMGAGGMSIVGAFA